MRLAVTLGDVRGIGPEIVRRATESPDVSRDTLVLIGPKGTDDGSGPYEPVSAPASDPGRAAGQAIEVAARLALGGIVDGIVTAPVHKPSLARAGFDVPGHTEMLRDLAGVREVGMLMCDEADSGESRSPLRVLLATTHIALRDVPRAVTVDRLVGQTRLLGESLIREWGIERPRVALCALNPHASDGGLFGDEEERVFGPALEELGTAPWTTTGPVPADTVFRRCLRGEFDAVVAPYHDVGMAAFKTASFGSGVNVTLGLPFVRTSPDHGTAFDIAGTGKADPSSMIQALRLATRLAARRSPGGAR